MKQILGLVIASHYVDKADKPDKTPGSRVSRWGLCQACQLAFPFVLKSRTDKADKADKPDKGLGSRVCLRGSVSFVSLVSLLVPLF